MPGPKTAVELSDTAAEAIRGLNRATLDIRCADGGLVYPGDAYTTVANLKTLAQRLPQAFEQTLYFIKGLHDDGNLYSCGNGYVTDHVKALEQALREAMAAARSMADALDRAHSALSPLGYQDH